MMFKSLIISLGLMLSASTAFAASLPEVASSTYKLYDGNRFVCSAVAISPNQLVTAAHCIDDHVNGRDKVAVWIDKWERTQLIHREIIMMVTLRTNTDDDVAFLEVRGDSKFSTYVSLADEFSPTIGDPLFAVGYPRGMELTLTEGMFTAETNLEKEMGNKGTFWKVTVPITGGSSGGGFYIRNWVNGAWDYELVGLSAAGYRDVSFQNYISTLDAVRNVTKGLLTLPDVEPSEEIYYNPKDFESLINAEK